MFLQLISHVVTGDASEFGDDDGKFDAMVTTSDITGHDIRNAIEKLGKSSAEYHV